jgi:hypothetical protein
MAVDRQYGTAALLHNKEATGGLDRVLAFGGWDDDGSNAPTSSVQEYEQLGETPTDAVWRTKAPMLHSRMFLNAVTLPTGRILLLGGAAGNDELSEPADPVYEPELYDPGVDPLSQGSTVALASPQSPATPRVYHSVALLLPDGRVFHAGGDEPGTHPNPYSGPPTKYTGQFFKPPYFFQGSRPIITQQQNASELSSPAQGETFEMWVHVPTQDTLDAIVLLRPGTVTHHFDTNQRYIELEYSVVTQGLVQGSPYMQYQLEVESPLETLGPPGHYMVFAIAKKSNGNRLPSVGEFMRFD